MGIFTRFRDIISSNLNSMLDKAEDPEKLIKALERVLARFKLPRKVFVIDELPRNAMGKVQKNLLREQFSTV